ncbi:lactonase family protein [Actinokineospora spheciospongiae]|uniref:lactonase family protein n=1 Tax=Actinokineospora spheciospongiae TaxID=909613 RepID=UPI00055614D0|nr:beta-propeller fold lactonase family protein [Actinokineospora spheciospongiae]PWW50824.1 YVTN family beta-propeller protein [Actinokineospora spheciospongiae]
MRTAVIGTIDGDGLVVADVLDDGALAVTRALPEVREPSFLHLAGGTLYAVNELPEGTVTALDPTDLTVRRTRPTLGAQPTHLTTHAGHLVVAHYLDGTVGAHPLAADGTPGESSTRLRHDGAEPHAHQVLPDPSGRWLISVDLGSDAVHTHRIVDGALTAHARLDLPPGLGPRHLAFHGDRAHILGELRPELVAADWDAATGTFTPAWALPLPAGNQPAEIVLSPDGRFAYATLRGDNTVAVVDLEHREVVQAVPVGGDWPRHCALDGTHLYVANQRSHSVTRLPWDPATGLLSEPVGETRVRGASVVAFLG